MNNAYHYIRSSKAPRLIGLDVNNLHPLTRNRITKCLFSQSSRHEASIPPLSRGDKVKIVEVGPRDGLQNESKVLASSTKIELIKKLVKAGCTNIETASFVSPKWVPAMADSSEVMMGLKEWRTKQLKDQNRNATVFSVLTPNLVGFENAMKVGKGGVDEVAIFGAASETFSKKNIGCSVQESLTRFQDVVDAAKHYDVPVRGYISCVLGCPYEKDIDICNVAKLAEQLVEMGCHEISLGDTIGVGTPDATIRMINEVKSVVDPSMIAVHFHDTYGQALANIYAALGEGIRTVDSSVAGLGGCPYAHGASGNVATEDVVYMLNGMDMYTGIELSKLVQAGSYICDALEIESSSKCARAIQNECQ
jgi:hydroxymethylglutaryl-CoA lyase